MITLARSFFGLGFPSRNNLIQLDKDVIARIQLQLAYVATAVVWLVRSSYLRELQNLTNQIPPCALSTNSNHLGRVFTVPCSVWKVYRLGCKVSAVCKPKLVGKRTRISWRRPRRTYTLTRIVSQTNFARGRLQIPPSDAAVAG